MKKANTWMQRIKQFQETGKHFNDSLFADTCHNNQSLHSKEMDIPPTGYTMNRTIEFSHNGSYFIASGLDKLWFWPINKALDCQNNLKPLQLAELGSKETITSLAINPDNRRILSGGLKGKITIYDSKRLVMKLF